MVFPKSYRVSSNLRKFRWQWKFNKLLKKKKRWHKSHKYGVFFCGISAVRVEFLGKQQRSTSIFNKISTVTAHRWFLADYRRYQRNWQRSQKNNDQSRKNSTRVTIFQQDFFLKCSQSRGEIYSTDIHVAGVVPVPEQYWNFPGSRVI